VSTIFACWALSNIAVDPEQAEHVMAAGFISPLVSILRNDESVVKREALWTLCNALTCGTDAHVRTIAATEGLIAHMCDLLMSEDGDTMLAAMQGPSDSSSTHQHVLCCLPLLPRLQ
jgi:hypothetical protein